MSQAEQSASVNRFRSSSQHDLTRDMQDKIKLGLAEGHAAKPFNDPKLDLRLNIVKMQLMVYLGCFVVVFLIWYSFRRISVSPSSNTTDNQKLLKHHLNDKETIWNIACHEAGHTIVAYYTTFNRKDLKTTIVPMASANRIVLGHATYPQKLLPSKADLKVNIAITLGGRAAEEVVFGADNVTIGSNEDLLKATTIASMMVRSSGMSEKFGLRVLPHDNNKVNSKNAESSYSLAQEEFVDKEIDLLIKESYQRALNIIRTHSDEHRRLALALVKYKTLDADDIKHVIEGRQVHLSKRQAKALNLRKDQIITEQSPKQS